MSFFIIHRLSFPVLFPGLTALVAGLPVWMWMESSRLSSIIFISHFLIIEKNPEVLGHKNTHKFLLLCNFLKQIYSCLVLQVWSLPNPLMQTKATIMSKSPLLSLEWATKPDRLVRKRLHLTSIQTYLINSFVLTDHNSSFF